MSKYLMKFSSAQASAIVEYQELGYLIKFEFDPGAFTKEQFIFLFERFPIKLEKMEEWMKAKFKNVIITELSEDLSFEAFYNTYNYKVSKRAVSEKIWNKMPEIERAKALKHIAVYEMHLIKSGVNKKYPETYLNSEMWNN